MCVLVSQHSLVLQGCSFALARLKGLFNICCEKFLNILSRLTPPASVQSVAQERSKLEVLLRNVGTYANCMLSVDGGNAEAKQVLAHRAAQCRGLKRTQRAG